MPEIVAPQPRVHGSADSAGSAPLSGESKRQPKTISAVGFYDEYHGHPISDLEVLLPALRPRAVTWLVGDSSLDNKHWLFDAHRNGSDTAALPLCAATCSKVASSQRHSCGSPASLERPGCRAAPRTQGEGRSRPGLR